LWLEVAAVAGDALEVEAVEDCLPDYKEWLQDQLLQ
jgi:hypothetical protein